ncbi:MAG: histidine phosphatase family protein [Myxococcota bacterium]
MLLVRHGPVDAEPARCWGWTDVALAPSAELDARLAALPVAEGALVVSSDLQRARSTAERLVALHPGTRLGRAQFALRELHFGRWEGLRWEEIERREPEAYAAYMERWRDMPCPGGESWIALRDRCARWLESAPPEPLVVVAHQGSLRALWALLAPEARALRDAARDQEAMRRRWAYGEGHRVPRDRPRSDR